MTTLTLHDDGLRLLRTEFPKATVKALKYAGGYVYGYEFKIGRSRHFAQIEPLGGINYASLKLFFDCQVYARDRRVVKRELRALRGAAL